MTLFDDSNAPYSDSSTTTLTEQQPANETHEAHAERPQETAASQHQHHDHQTDDHQHEDQKSAASDDFASALESFTTEAEETVGEDHVIKGTVLKLSATHVFVDIGAKSEGMLPIGEVLDHEGQPKFQPGDAIDVIRE